MRLLNPNPGECVDRQTILELKITAAVEKKIWAKPWGDECNAIQDYLEKNWLMIAPKTLQHDYDSLYKELKRINGELWKLEDEIRELAKKELTWANGEKDRVVEIALLIPKLNDERAEAVRKLNALFTISSQEKIYK